MSSFTAERLMGCIMSVETAYDRFDDETVNIILDYDGLCQGFGCVRFGDLGLVKQFLRDFTKFMGKTDTSELVGMAVIVEREMASIKAIINPVTKETFSVHAWFMENHAEYRARFLQQIADKTALSQAIHRNL